MTTSSLPVRFDAAASASAASRNMLGFPSAFGSEMRNTGTSLRRLLTTSIGITSFFPAAAGLPKPALLPPPPPFFFAALFAALFSARPII